MPNKGILKYNIETQIAQFDVHADVSLIDLIQVWRELVASGQLPIETRKFIVNQGNFKLTDSAHIVLASKNKWTRIFPNTMLALISEDPKGIALATALNKQNGLTRLFSNVDDALFWLKQN